MWSRIYAQLTGTTTTSNPSPASPPASTLNPQQENNLQATRSSSPDHLIILVNGLFGSRYNWEYISEVLHAHLDTNCTLIHASKANEFAATYAGIDTCGSALAVEIKNLVAATPSLQRISFIGHSMGGLISRYAAGELYDTKTGFIASLKPCHFVSMATPHLGCHPEDASPAQVPIVSWLKPPGNIELPFGLHNLLGVVSPTIASTAFRRSGSQFFLNDGENDNPPSSSPILSSGNNNSSNKSISHLRPPLLYRLSQDCPSENRYFWSALASFETRTAYANSSGDYFVGWANSSVRDIDELPKFPPGTKGRGVIREDPLEMAWAPDLRPAVEIVGDAVGLDPGHGHVAQSVRDIMDASSAQDLIFKEDKDEESVKTNGTITGSICINSIVPGRDISQVAGEEIGENLQTRSEYVKASLASLQRLQWRRIDVCFAGGALPLLAHQHMQVQRKWVNYEGKATAKHLALQLAAMEEIRKRSGSGAATAAAVGGGGA